MSLADEMRLKVKEILREQWTTRKGTVVPESTDLGLGNDAVEITGTVLYADLSASTALVDNYEPRFAAEVYKAYLYCAAKIIRSEGGVITAYDGDRVMAVYLGDTKNTSAARTGLKVNWAVKNIVNPLLKAQYPDKAYEVKQTIGIDTSQLFVARTGIRGANDLVWVGHAANHAAKLASLPADFATWISSAVHDVLLDSVKANAGRAMWEKRAWTAMDNAIIYRSNWTWAVE